MVAALLEALLSVCVAGREGWGLKHCIGCSEDQQVLEAPDSMPSEALSKPEFTHL